MGGGGGGGGGHWGGGGVGGWLGGRSSELPEVRVVRHPHPLKPSLCMAPNCGLNNITLLSMK